MRSVTLSQRPIGEPTSRGAVSAAAEQGCTDGWALTPEGWFWLRIEAGSTITARMGNSELLPGDDHVADAYELTFFAPPDGDVLAREVRWVDGHGAVVVDLNADPVGVSRASGISYSTWQGLDSVSVAPGWSVIGQARTGRMCVPAATEGVLHAVEVFSPLPDGAYRWVDQLHLPPGAAAEGAE